MADQILDEFVKEALASGSSRQEIVSALKDAGWPADQVDNALAGYADIDFPVPVPRPRRYGSAREAFSYLVYFFLLGAVALSVGAIAFAFVDANIADDLDRSRSSLYGLRWQVSWLLVGFPIFIFLGARLGAARRADPNRRTSRLRAWLTYITLIFAALALIGDLVAVVYGYLDGDVSARFLSKAFIVAAISGTILVTYSRDAERVSSGGDVVGRGLALLASLVTVGLVIWAFTVVLTPGAVRDLKIDNQRISDLGSIVRLVDCHASYFDEAPDDLAEGAGRLAEYAASNPVAYGCAADLPKDPITKQAYQYQRTSKTTFTVCASFSRGWPEGREPDGQRQRRIARFGGYAGGRRYIDLPTGPGERCYDFTARDMREKTD